jgi:pimeloyl-ACP methyl ester carboxylesterase
MPMLDRDGVKIHYDVSGRGPHTLLLTHGFAASSTMYEAIRPALGEDYTVIIWDMRGHGRSDYPEDPDLYSAALSVEDIRCLLDEVGARRAVIGGHSLGGYLALEFYLAHPDYVEALLLIDTGPGFRKDEARAAWNQVAEHYATELTTRGMDGLPCSEERRPQDHRDTRGLVHAARRVLTQRDSRVLESLPDINVPTLVLVGSEDEPFFAGTRYIAQKIPGANRIVIAGAGHAPPVTHPDQVTEHVLALARQLREQA